MINKNVLRLTRTSLIAAVALALAYLEMIIPDLPMLLPGMKLGLSNIAVMFALVILDLPSALFICLLKAVFALLTRGLVSFLMSLCGGILSVIAMYLIMRLKSKEYTFGYLGIGIIGAFFHNFGQILVGVLLLDKTVFAYLPILSLVSIVTGSITGIVLSLILPALIKTKLFYVDNGA